MAKEKWPKPTPHDEQPALANEADATEPVPVRRYAYIGPAYVWGTVIPGTNKQVRPAEMTDEEIDALIAYHAPAADWFKNL